VLLLKLKLLAEAQSFGNHPPSIPLAKLLGLASQLPLLLAPTSCRPIPTPEFASCSPHSCWTMIRNDYLLNLRGADACRGAKFANTRAGATVEALTDRHGKPANTMAKKEDMLRGESFPQMSTTSTSNYPWRSMCSSPNTPTPRLVEAGKRGCNPQARNGRLHETHGVSLHLSTMLHGDSC
jgi:hypothetical protein